MYFYISNPYNGSVEEKEARALAAAKACAVLLRQGIHAWSPIVHNHAMMKAFDIFSLEERRTVILNFDFSLLKPAKGMIVLELDGWRRSYGVNAEIAFAKEHGIPIFYLHPSKLDLISKNQDLLQDNPSGD